MEIAEPSAELSVERWIEEPGRRAYGAYLMRLKNKRPALIRDQLVGLVDQSDDDLTAIHELAGIAPEAIIDQDFTARRCPTR